MKTKVKDVMTPDVRTCRPDASLAEATKEFWDADCGALPVVSDEGRVIGMITDRDICIAVATKGRTADRIAVREVTTNQAHTCLADDDIAVALQTMKTHQVRRLPVVDAEGHLRGILSLNDIVTRSAAAPAQVMSTLAKICEHRRPTAIAGAA